MTSLVRGREPWSRESVWRKLSAFSNVKCLAKNMSRECHNAEDIMFALRTAKSFLMDNTADLASSLIHSYYGCFWTLSAITMIEDDSVGVNAISGASAEGHGLCLRYQYDDSPLNWRVFIQQSGFMNYILGKSPFTTEVDRVALPARVGKKDAMKESSEYLNYGYLLDDLMSRIPEISWHYELLTQQPIKCIKHEPRSKLIHASKRASPDLLKKLFPFIDNLKIDEDYSQRMAEVNQYNVGYVPEDKVDESLNPIFHSSLLTEANAIAKLDKPLNYDLLRHALFSYAWSIIARYSPQYFQRIESGDLADWRPYLDEYNWFVRIRFPTACLNQLTKSEWRFSPPALYGG